MKISAVENSYMGQVLIDEPGLDNLIERLAENYCIF